MKIRTIIKKLIEIEKKLPKADIFVHTDEEIGILSKIKIPKTFESFPDEALNSPDPNFYKDGIIILTGSYNWQNFKGPSCDNNDNGDCDREWEILRKKKYKTR